MSDPFIGEIRMVGFNFAPVGWALCQGQLLSIAQNTALFSLLGTTYGGDGQTTFGLPDLQGRSPVGTGAGPGLAPINPGDRGGQESVTLNVDNMPAHMHAVPSPGNVSVTGPVAIPATTTSSTTDEGAAPATDTVLGPVGQGGRPGVLYSKSQPNTTLAPFNATLQGAVPAGQTAFAGGNLPVAVRNPYLGLTCIIALQGMYPSRQ